MPRMSPPPERTLICIRPSPIHGLGGFAATAIPQGSRIIEYTGDKITKAESLERCRRPNEFIFYLNETHDLDGNVASNPARFLNHSCSPNCEAVLIAGHLWIVAKQSIAAGTELTFDYGYDLEDFHEYPCHCGTPNCRGYIVAAELAPVKDPPVDFE